MCGPPDPSLFGDRSDAQCAQVRTLSGPTVASHPSRRWLVPQTPEWLCPLFLSTQGDRKPFYLGLAVTLAGSGACFVSEKLLKTFFFNHCGLRAKKPIYSAYFTKSMLYGRQYWRCWEPSKGERCPGEGVLTVYRTASLPGSLYGLASRNQQFG